MNKQNNNRGSTTIIATGTIITMMLTVLTGVLAYTFNDKVNGLASVQTSVNIIETESIPNLETRTALVEKDISYIRASVDDIKNALNVK